jgi:hypothetical protein
MSINVPAGTFTAADLAAINAAAWNGAPIQATFTDDDATTLPHLPDGGNLLASAFGMAYILPIYVDPGPDSWNVRGTVPFRTKLEDNLDAIDGLRDLTSKEDFWTTLLVGAYENKAWTDGDPDGDWPVGTPLVGTDSKFDWGVSDKNNRSAIFLETIRDVGPAQGKTEPLIVTHEIGHTAANGLSGPGFDWYGHTLGGAEGEKLEKRHFSIMNEAPNSAQDTLFDNETQAFFRSVKVW